MEKPGCPFTPYFNQTAAIPLSAEERLLYILKRLRELPVDIRISGKASNLKFSSSAYTYIGRLPLLSVFD